MDGMQEIKFSWGVDQFQVKPYTEIISQYKIQHLEQFFVH